MYESLYLNHLVTIKLQLCRKFKKYKTLHFGAEHLALLYHDPQMLFAIKNLPSLY